MPKINSFNKLIFSGISVTSIDVATKILGQFFLQLFLAKILSIEQFGTVVVILLVTNILKPIADLGLTHTLITKNNNTNNVNKFSTAFTILLFFNTLLLSMVLLASNFFGIYFNDEIFSIAIPASCSFLILSPFISIYEAIATIEMKFQKIAIINIISNLMSFAFVILLLQFDFGIWSMVFYNPLLYLCTAILYLINTKYKISLNFNKTEIVKQLNFGISVTGTKLIGGIHSQYDYFIVTKLIDIASLGLYSFAFQLTSILRNTISSITSRVFYPLFSKSKKNLIKVKSFYSLNIKLNVILVGFLVILILLFINELLFSLYGDKWSGSIIYIKILAIAFLVGSTVNSNTILLRSIGLPAMELKIQVLKILIFLPLIYFSTFYYGLIGTSISILIYITISVIIALYILKSLLKYTIKDYIEDIAQPFLAIIFSYFIGLYLVQMTNVLLVNIILYTALYFSLIFILMKKDIIKILNNEN